MLLPVPSFISESAPKQLLHRRSPFTLLVLKRGGKFALSSNGQGGRLALKQGEQIFSE
jgi:hypothetical protein